MEGLPPNHHADYPQFTGVFGYLAGLTMTVGRGRDARLVAGLAEVGADDHVVDVGCGPGTAARMTARRGADVTGVDPSEPMLRLADLLSRFPRTEGGLDWKLAGAENLGLEDGSATACWSLASVHHWPDLESGIAEAYRVLKPGGVFMALEKRTEPGATGNASHGWTNDQANRFAEMLEEHGFERCEASNHDLGRRKVVVVTGHKPG
ncbi:MAG: class I SAM-dependent methyltransferase [Acidimicrobiales bacterium]